MMKLLKLIEFAHTQYHENRLLVLKSRALVCVFSFVLVSIFTTPHVSASEGTNIDKLLEMSLEELMELKVTPAAITRVTFEEAPASITVITADDIKYTPARNIYDLIEVYVPGAIWMNYEEGPLLGMRGNVVDRNYKYLLRVNGRLMNGKDHYSAKSELEQWDLSDIQRIEIVRGPGSVTYGPGAVAGVINIITHTAATSEGVLLSARYVETYNSRGITFSQGNKTKQLSTYTFASITKTDGDNSPQYLVTNNNEAGYIGEDILQSTEPLDYFADYQDEPQIKYIFDAQYKNNWRFWLRYTQQGSTWRGNETKTLFDGQLVNQQGVRDRRWTATVEHFASLNKSMKLTTMFSLDSFDAERRRDRVLDPDPDDVKNFKYNYSETELFARSLLNWNYSDSTEIAVGAEFSRENFGPGWGSPEEEMRLGEDGLIVSGTNSDFVPSVVNPDTATFAGDGWYTSTYSLFGEANMILSPKNRLMVSARFDKNTYTDWLISPRVAIITKLTPEHLIKVIAQRSQRMGTAGQLYVEDKKGVDSENETLDSLEVVFNAKPNKRLSYNLTGFINDAEVIAWSGDKDALTLVGDLQTYGLEGEILYKWPTALIGANYSFVKQKNWELSSEFQTSSISYSDYNQTLRDGNGDDTSAVMLDEGNDLNNWPNQALKIFARKKLSRNTTLHVDARLIWDYQGAKDGLDSLESAVQGLPEEAAVEQTLEEVRDKDVYEYDFRLNMSLFIEAKKDLTIKLYAQNLLGENDNKRYSFDSGNDRAAPKRVRYVEEPRSFGIRIDKKFN